MDSLNYPIKNDEARDVLEILNSIYYQDNEEITKWVFNNPNKVPNLKDFKVREKRFSNAFDRMFNGIIKYKGLNQYKTPVFVENETEIPIKNLSSGEKQIVFRSILLLKNLNLKENFLVLIDEPELSMHPKWEEKAFDFYCDLFKISGIQKSQIFIATHSAYILKSAIERDNCVVIKLSNENPKHFFKNSSNLILPTLTLGEIKYNIFDTCTVDFHIALFGYIGKIIVKRHKIKSIDC